MGQEGIILISDGCSFPNLKRMFMCLGFCSLLIIPYVCMIVSLPHWLFHLLFTTSP